MRSRNESRVLDLAKKLKIAYEVMERTYSDFGRTGNAALALDDARAATTFFKDVQARFFEAVADLDIPFDVIDADYRVIK